MKKFIHDDIKDAIEISVSWAEVCRKLYGNIVSGSTQSKLKKYAIDKGFDYSHFTGRAWNKGNRGRYKLLDEEIFINPSTANRGVVKYRLMNRPEFIHKCELCGMEKWVNGELIPLVLDHIDGKGYNNMEDNLRFICPNCDTFTKHYKGRNIIYKTQVTDEEILEVVVECGSAHQVMKMLHMTIHGSSKKRIDKLMEVNNLEFKTVAKKEIIKKPRPTKFHITQSELVALVCDQKIPFTTIGKQYGVSDNAIRKRCIKMNIDPNTRTNNN